MEPLEISLRDTVLIAERNCAEWRDEREANQNRFAVDDTREKSVIDAEKNGTNDPEIARNTRK